MLVLCKYSNQSIIYVNKWYAQIVDKMSKFMKMLFCYIAARNLIMNVDAFCWLQKFDYINGQHMQLNIMIIKLLIVSAIGVDQLIIKIINL
jgi:hypothetical protein